MKAKRWALGVAALMFFGSVVGADVAVIQKKIDTTFAVPNDSGNFTGVTLIGGDAGATAVIGNYLVGAQSYSGLYSVKGASVLPLVDRHTPGPAGETITSIIGAGDFLDGQIVFAANTSAGQALYRYSAGGLSVLARQGDPLADGSGSIQSFFNKALGGDPSQFSFAAQRADSTYGIYQSLGSVAVRLADDKTRSPVAETGTFVDFPEISSRDGKTAYVARAIETDRPGNIIEPVGVFVSTPGNPIETIAGKHTVVPGAANDNMRFNEFEKPRIGPDGRVSFTGGFVDESVPLDQAPHFMGIFTRNADRTWKQWINSEMNLPGLQSQVFEFNGYSFESGVNVFGAVDTTDHTYLYYENGDGVFTHIIDSYMLLDGKAINRLRLAMDSAVAPGEIAFTALFTDGTSGVYSISVPEPGTMSLAALSLLMLARRRTIVR